MFLGQYERSLDEKSRLAIPAELRSGLGTGAVITRSFDNCLCIYPASRWEVLANALDDFPQVRSEARILARSLFGGAVPCDFDRQGRIVVPAFLREHAGISGEIIIVGVNSHVEVWSRDAWLEQKQRFEKESAQLAEALSIR
ncbi:MAG TPA: division/cell wall cluster transcriptional repressor MraZ [Chloroflexota bacterium]